MDKGKHDKHPGQKPAQGKPQQADPRRPSFDEMQDDTTRQEQPGSDQADRQPGAFEPDDAEGAGIDRKDGERSDRDAGAGRPVQLDEDEGGSPARR